MPLFLPTLPVVVSRIQNRRGTQEQFNGYSYTISGPNSVYPSGYNGIGGYSSFPDFTETNYPHALLPGEIAFCTDSRRIYIGNLNGEYAEIDTTLGDGLFLQPLSWDLPPTTTYLNITRVLSGPLSITLEYDATPFFNILYELTDATSLNRWNVVGHTYSRNGQLQITAVDDFAPIPNPPFPDITSVTLIDAGTEINTNGILGPLPTISFKAQYNGSKIEILYKHTFPDILTLNTSTISWIPFIPTI